MTDDAPGARSINTGVRIPLDLIEVLDARRRARNLSRSEVIVAAMRMYLNTPAPVVETRREPEAKS